MAYDLTDKPTQQLLAFIRRAETGRDDRPSYDTMFGFRPISPPLTAMTIDQAIAAGPDWTRRHGSSAAGAYQFMNATLRDLARVLQLSGRERLEPDFQDWLALQLLNRRGYQDFLSSKISLPQFAENLAREWAGLPVLLPTQGAHRKIKRGESYYSGDSLNSAVVTADDFEEALLSVLVESINPSAGPEDPNRPIKDYANGLLVFFGACAAGAVALFSWLGNAPCNLFGVFCG